MVGRGASRYLRLGSNGPELLGTVLCVGLIVSSAVSATFAYRPKQDFEGALTLIEEQREPDDAVAVAGLAEMPYRRFFRTDWTVVSTAEELNEVRRNAKRTWMVYTLPIHFRAAYPELLSLIQDEFEVVKRLTGSLRGGTVYVCRSAGFPARRIQDPPGK